MAFEVFLENYSTDIPVFLSCNYLSKNVNDKGPDTGKPAVVTTCLEKPNVCFSLEKNVSHRNMY